MYPGWIPSDRPIVPIVSSIDEAKSLGTTTLIIALTYHGGRIPDDLYSEIDLAVNMGLNIVNGLHDPLKNRYINLKLSQYVWDIRREPDNLPPGTGAAASLNNRRVLFLGTDMAVGKMTAGLELYLEMQKQHMSVGFVATGQIGMAITGSGIPLDAVRVDFAAGAIESEVLKNSDKDWVLVEGQGSFAHPGSTGPLPLLRGSMSTDLVMCHRAGMDHLRRAPHIKTPPLKEFMTLVEDISSACGSLPRTVCRAIALNTCDFSDAEAIDEIRRIEDETGLPAFDVVKFGASGLLNLLTNTN